MSTKIRQRYCYILGSGRAIQFQKLGLSDLNGCMDRAEDKHPEDQRRKMRQNSREIVMAGLLAITASPLEPIFKPLLDDKGQPQRNEDGSEKKSSQLDEDKMLASVPPSGWVQLDYLGFTTPNSGKTIDDLFDDEPGDYGEVLAQISATTFEKKRPGGSSATRRPLSLGG